MDDQTRRTIFESLSSALIGDVLDTAGRRHQMLPQGIKPLVPGTRILGRAMPVLECDMLDGAGEGPLAARPFGLMFEALDSLLPGEIYIASGSSFDYALWGGLMSLRAQTLGAAGAILNGYIRDTDEIRRLGFPVFSCGSYAQDQGVRGKVVGYRTRIRIGQTDIAPGDLIFGDDEGVLVIPADIEQEIIAAAAEKARTENKVAKAIRGGMSTVEAFETFGVM